MWIGKTLTDMSSWMLVGTVERLDVSAPDHALEKFETVDACYGLGYRICNSYYEVGEEVSQCNISA